MYKYVLIILSIVFIFCTKTNGRSNFYPDQNPTIASNPQNQYKFYIGTYTNKGSKGIYSSSYNEISGKIAEPVEVSVIDNASFQCITANNEKLFSVSEFWGGTGKVVAYNINASTGALTVLNEFSSEGQSPCFVAFHEASNSILTANYSSGNVVRIMNDGKTFNHQHTGNSIHKSRQKSAHAHSIKIDLSGNFAYSCDLGTDKVYVYDLREDGLKLYTEIDLKPGAGPRHLDFHPEMKAMCVINELNSTIDVFLPDSNQVFTKHLTTISTIPNDFFENNLCADIHYSSDGKLLFASNRGYNSIVSYKVDQESMKLELIGHTQETINSPRNFALSPDNKYIFVANQEGNSISVFENKDGLLLYTGSKLNISKPVCITFLNDLK